MTGKHDKLPLILASGALGMLIGIFGLLLFQMVNSSQAAERPLPARENVFAEQSPSKDAVFMGDPFQSMRKIQQQMLQDFEQSFSGFENDFFSKSSNQLNFFERGQNSYQISSRETQDSLIYELELENNVEGDSVNVNVENGLVTISGRKSMSNEDSMESGRSFFSSTSSFSQSFSVPSNVDSNNVKISNQGNKIILTFPKWGQEV